MDFHGITIDRIRHNGMYSALVPGAGYVKSDTLHGIKKLIRERWEPAATVQTRFPFMVHVFEVDSDNVLAASGSAYTDTAGSVTRAPIRSYKVYHNANRDDYFIRIHGRPIWFSEMVRTGTPWG